ncbi:MAG: hypothetical protein WBV26_24345 [Candidatus Sulfotelmatobacter sp.]
MKSKLLVGTLVSAPVLANLAAGFEVETVQGTHLDVVTTHFEGLAAVLTRYAKEALCE